MYNVTFIAETTRKSVDMSMQSGIIISRITGVTGTTAVNLARISADRQFRAICNY